MKRFCKSKTISKEKALKMQCGEFSDKRRVGAMRSCAHDGPSTSCSHSASAHVHCAPDTRWALGVMLGREGEPDGRKHFVHRLLFSVRSTKVVLHVEGARLAGIPDRVRAEPQPHPEDLQRGQNTNLCRRKAPRLRGYCHRPKEALSFDCQSLCVKKCTGGDS